MMELSDGGNAKLTTTSSICVKYGLPVFSEEKDFDQWVFEIDMWQGVTDVPLAKHGPLIFLSLNEKTREGCSSLTKSDLQKENGVELLTNKLRELYGDNEDQATFKAYEKFQTFTRPSNMSINEYISRFENLNQKLINYKMELPSPALAYCLLNNANLPDDRTALIRATTVTFTYDNMKKQLKAVFDKVCTDGITPAGSEELPIKVEDAFYGQQQRGRFPQQRFNNYRANSRRNYRSGYRGNNNNYNQRNTNFSQKSSKTKNAPGPDGYPRRCNVCESIYHFANACPEIDSVSEEVHVQLYTKGVSQCFLEQVVSESLNCALLDTGCTATVCGINWLQCYKDSLSPGVVLQENFSDKKFKFGDGSVYPSLKQVNLIVDIGGLKGNILTDVVDCEVPLLLSKNSLKAADSHLDFVNDVITMYGQTIPLMHTSNGHYCFPISRKWGAMFPNSDPKYAKVNITFDKESLTNPKTIATKLHKQFGHPVDSAKLKQLVTDSGNNNTELLSAIDEVTESCDVCNKYKKARSKPIVSLPLSQEFNDLVAMDLKFIKVGEVTHTILHIIDVFTRFSAATVISAKRKVVIVDSILRIWVSTFGSPRTIFSDNGGEFNNELLRDIAELINTKVLTTAAESPWSNGVCERHNAIIENMVLKIIETNKCSVENALVWAISAKNALHNNLGFSPNQLVFGRNPNFPCVLTDNPPALRTSSPSELIAEHLNALATARKAFIQSESSQKLKRALNHQTRESSGKEFVQGDRVYYKRNNSKAWNGPGIICGTDGKQIFVKHGGNIVRVHSCSIRKVLESENSLADEAMEFPLEKSNNLQKTQHTIENVINDTLIEPLPAVATPVPAENVSLEDSSKERQIVSAYAKISLPKIKDRVSFCDPDSNQQSEFSILSRAGKAGGRHPNWLNVKNLDTGEIKAIDFTYIDWSPVIEEVQYTEALSHGEVQAQQQELERWKRYNVYSEVEDKGQSTVTTRWVWSEKRENGKIITKARLVARGFEEDSSQFRTDSPTIIKENIRLVSYLAIQNKWKIHSMDVKSAFLQGFRIERDVFLLPPPEVNTGKLWKLNCSVYGLCDASRAWYLKVSDELLKIGVSRSIYDYGLFFSLKNNKLQGLFCCHVDDFYYMGCGEFHDSVVQHIRNKFQLSKEVEGAFKFLGISLVQEENSIIMSQQDYIDTICPIPLPKGFQMQKKLDRSEARLLKGLLGQLQWVSKQTRPDLAFSVCELSTRVKNGTMSDIVSANKAVIKLKSYPSNVQISHTGDIATSALLVFSDASHANLQDCASQGGFVILIKGSNGKVAPLVWVSRKLKRVVKSAMAAETMSLLEGAEHAFMIKATLIEVSGSGKDLPVILLTDSKQLYDNLLTTHVCDDKRLHCDISAIRQMIHEKDISTVRHVSAKQQLADGLTKATASCQQLLDVISGRVSLSI